MKKILIVFLCLLFFAPAFAVNDVSFIYINASNNNDEKMKNWYEEGVRKLHPVLRKSLKKILLLRNIIHHWAV